ncbi:N-acetyltransferase [Rhodococcoides trifolii]|uniref:N-acetyltransferase n=1 Tax=Rhodococcoides trifolii TaxID=908250 RepID=A0A917FUH7_9NOCA|nr:GNAT family N-acetyltransferase [Rhodococcus trifolii]GGG06458.1 N-acetyltransferase [Rhodococcus trifolii]
MDELLTVTTCRLDDPDVLEMIEEVQQEYVRRYGGPDDTPLFVGEFVPPAGVMFVARIDGRAVGMGGWRAHENDRDGILAGDAEIKRMYVRPTAQRRGIARRVLGAIEESAARAGRRRLILETGTAQPEALALYASNGFDPMVPKFGHYRHEESSVCMVKDLSASP